MPKRNAIKIRNFQTNDLNIVKNLIGNTIDLCYSDVYPKEAIHFFENWHCDENILKDAKEGDTIILQKDNRIIGTGTIVENEIRRVFVEPSFQNQGFGKIIMQKLEEKALLKGLDIVKLDATLLSNKFYDSLGYIILEETFLEVDNGKRLDYYKMEKCLKPGVLCAKKTNK